MVLINLLFFLLTFYQLIGDLDATLCPKGQGEKRINGHSICEVCTDEHYRPEKNKSPDCSQCTKCDGKRWSHIKQKCTKETDTICQCRGDFVPLELDSSTCKCDIGFGLRNGECSKCEAGYFSIGVNSPCQKWRECKSGVNRTGTSTSDVTCNELESNPGVTAPFITRLTPHRPHEKTNTHNVYTTTSTAAPRGHTVTKKHKEKVDPFPSSNTGMVLVMLGIVGLLLLTAVTCKLHINPCEQRKPAVQTNDSLCRRPVEESGDSSLSSLKLNPGEP
ncbi:tumor necrosis factor receptor superfamily member 1B [Scophthalmus maximus]|nr:tumor necrosis factor receptor superfamily member 1B [Scophthalmus maximus]